MVNSHSGTGWTYSEEGNHVHASFFRAPSTGAATGPAALTVRGFHE